MIRFNNPAPLGDEAANLVQALAQGHLSGDGPFTRRSQAVLQDFIPGSRVLLTTSCTHALEMAALLLDAEPGDEVIMPPFTFVSTANAFVLRGLRPVFVDIRPDTLNIDERQIEAAVTHRTRAIVVVHYAGVGCEMDVIVQIAQRRGLFVIEDNAHGLFGRYRGRNLGTFGSLATLSFHETKNISCGEGGALLINDPELVERAEILREKGTNRSRFFRGQVDKYSWVDIGSSFLPSDILAAFLYAQLEARQDIQDARRKIWNRYSNHLTNWAQRQSVRLPWIPAHCDQSYHMFYMVMPSARARDGLIAHLKERGILGVFHYLPLHLSDMGRRCAAREAVCPVTEQISESLIRLPFYNRLTEDEQAQVIEAIHEFRG